MKIPFEIPRSRLRDNIKMNLKEIGLDAVEMIRQTYTRVSWWDLANIVMNRIY
jgi:hypothetical protein